MQGDLVHTAILIGLLARMEQQRKAADIARLDAWNKANPDKCKKRIAEWAKNNPDRIKATRFKYNRTAKSRARLSAYAARHPDKIKAIHALYAKSEAGKRSKKAWQQRNPDKMRAQWRRRGKRRFATPHGRMIIYARRRIRDAVATAGKSMPASASKMLGCNWDQLKQHLESQFLPGMTWENYGPVWHCDHKIPIASFDLDDPSQVSTAFQQ